MIIWEIGIGNWNNNLGNWDKIRENCIIWEIGMGNWNDNLGNWSDKEFDFPPLHPNA